MYKVLITTSGTGSRLKGLTKEKNKSLVKIANKYVIDWIICAYDISTELVITIGYYGKEVQDYITCNYPKRKITFVPVDPFEGPGSSLGYSMLQASEFLQCPFIFHCNDTIVIDSIPTPEKHNWIGISKGSDSTIYNSQFYSTVLVDDSRLKTIQAKGAKKYDAFHIGLVGINDYKKFWTPLKTEYDNHPYDTSLNDVFAISDLINKGILFNTVEFKEWYDTGNLRSLDNAKKHLSRI